jgi:uncharacterized protein (DUF1810 family)
MSAMTQPSGPLDPFDLDRFVRAQEADYDTALSEITRGRKHSHWMWYIFPQFDGLGFSAMSAHYSIKSLAEAEAYLAHPVLGPRLNACARALLAIDSHSARDIFGSPDDMKLRSSATLFAAVTPDGSLFHQIIDQYFAGEPDSATLRLLREAS